MKGGAVREYFEKGGITGFRFTPAKTKKELIFVCPSTDSKSQWLHDILLAIATFQSTEDEARKRRMDARTGRNSRHATLTRTGAAQALHELEEQKLSEEEQAKNVHDLVSQKLAELSLKQKQEQTQQQPQSSQSQPQPSSSSSTTTATSPPGSSSQTQTALTDSAATSSGHTNSTHRHSGSISSNSYSMSSQVQHHLSEQSFDDNPIDNDSSSSAGNSRPAGVGRPPSMSMSIPQRLPRRSGSVITTRLKPQYDGPENRGLFKQETIDESDDDDDDVDGTGTAGADDPLDLDKDDDGEDGVSDLSHHAFRPPPTQPRAPAPSVASAAEAEAAQAAIMTQSEQVSELMVGEPLEDEEILQIRRIRSKARRGSF